MVFSSPEFIFLFLPICVILYYFLLNSGRNRYLALYIFVVSLIYYGIWRPENIFVILSSIVVNYFIGMLISNIEYKKIPFYFGVIFNVGLIAYFKYTDFIITNINSVFGANVPLQEIVLPLGISFFTFQQISYIADIYTGKHDPTGEGFIN